MLLMMTVSELKHHIACCRLNEKDSQKKIYHSWFNRAKFVCEQYTDDHEELISIINRGFQRMFNQIGNFKPEPKNWMNSFDGWLRKMMIYSAIDHYRHHYRKDVFVELNALVIAGFIETECHTAKATVAEIQNAMKKLSPADSVFLKLTLIEKLDLHDIAECLNTSVETAETNLVRADRRLRELLFGLSAL